MASGQIITLIILILLSGFFSAAEIAFFSLSRLKVRHLIEKKKKNAELVKKLKDDQHKLLITLLIGNNLVNIAAAAIATSLAIKYFDNYGIGIATGVMTFLILIFGEITPKSFATQHNEKFCLFTARFIYFLEILLKPIIVLLELIIKIFVKIFGGSYTIKRPKITEEEIKSILTVGQEEGTIKDLEKEMITKIFEFDDIDVEQIMTPRVYMVGVYSNQKLKDVIKLLIEKHYSRIPVFQKNKDNVVGVIYLKDIMKYIIKGRLNVKVTDVMQKPTFIPETKKIDSLLRLFQKDKKQMAFVVDEHGGVSGLVTLEDVLEEIVGEIVDETEKIIPRVKKYSKDLWMVLGKAEIPEVNKKLKIGIKESDDYETLGGFIVTHLGRIPKIGEEIQLDNFLLTIEDVVGNRIKTVKIEKKKRKD